MSSTRDAVLEHLETPLEYRAVQVPRRVVRYSPEVADKLARCLAVGMSLRQACAQPGMPDDSSVREWLLDPDHPFFDIHEKAKKLSYHRMAEDILEIVDDGRNDWMQVEDPENPGWKFNNENYQRSKLRADKRQWMLSKMLPKIFGDKIQVDHTGGVEHRVMVRKAKVMDVLEYEDLAQLEAILSKAEALQIEGKTVDQEPDAE